MINNDKFLEITISDGQVQIEGFNFQGQGCAEMSALFQDALGETKTERKKPDYFSGSAGAQTIRARG